MKIVPFELKRTPSRAMRKKFSSVVACVTSSSCAGVASSASAASSWSGGYCVSRRVCGTRSKLVVEEDANHLPMRMMAVHRISRGGHSPSSSSSTTDATANEQQESSQTLQKKQRHPHSSSFDKKKRRSKKKTPTKIQQQQQQPVADDSDDNVIENGNCDGSINDVKKAPSSSSTNATSSTTATKQQSNSNNDKNDKIIESIIQQSCYYEILGITSAKHKLGTVTSNDIKKAYRRRCVITHPDKTRNGDRTAFDKVSEAYSILGDENKRAIYDRYGKVGLEQAASRSNTGGKGGMDTAAFFGNDLFREFFSSSSGPTADYPFSFGGSGSSSSSFRWSTPPPSTTRPPHMPKPRNRDLRYQLEVTLEELYMGSTKRVAIRQPNPLHPYYPYRKEVDVNLVPGMVHGQSIRLDGVVDSIVDAPPADVVFLLRECPHAIFARRGNDLVMELSITLSESIIGYRREIQLLDSTTIIIGNPFVTTKVKQQHIVDDNDGGHDDDDVNVVQDGMTSTSLIDDVVEDVTNTTISTTTSSFSTTRTTTAILSYDLPPTIVQTGDVHVLKGFGMPKRRSGGNGDDGGGGGRRYHDNNNYGDLYVQYKVEMPGVTATAAASATSSKGTNVQNLLPNERVQLARLLSKLEGINNSDNIIKHVIRRHEDVEDTIDNDNTITESTIRRRLEDDVDDTTVMIHHLEISSVADFGRAATNDQQKQQQDDDNLDELSHRGRSNNGLGDFFQRAFANSGGGLGGGGGFRYFSSSSSSSGGRGFGYDGVQEEEEDHKVECNQM